MNTFPQVVVIIVNYNGKHFLATCLDALRKQTYPEDAFEVIVSDNASSDGSVEFIETNYPWVRVVRNSENLGFASGNNVAIRLSQAKYCVLLNNDTAPTPTWLENIVKVAEENPRAGIVTGRLQMFYDQLLIEFQTETFNPPGDGRELGIQLYEVESNTPYGVFQYLNGFYGSEPSPYGSSFRWTKSKAVLGIPVPSKPSDWNLSLQMAAYRPDNQPVYLGISIIDDSSENTYKLFEDTIAGPNPTVLQLEIPASTRSLSFPVVQNAGSVVFRDGASRDRGSYVRDSQVFYEIDRDQYNKLEEVFSGCGANLLLRTSMLEDIGHFDDDFFMYYEDTDLAWRARLLGWDVLYAPDAIVRHFHCGTSKEWSPLFLFLIDRNRLAMVVKNGSLRQVLWTLMKYLGRTTINTLNMVQAYMFRRPNRNETSRWPRHHFRVLKSLSARMPSLVKKRIHIQKNRKVHPSTLKTWFLETGR